MLQSKLKKFNKKYWYQLTLNYKDNSTVKVQLEWSRIFNGKMLLKEKNIRINLEVKSTILLL